VVISGGYVVTGYYVIYNNDGSVYTYGMHDGVTVRDGSTTAEFVDRLLAKYPDKRAEQVPKITSEIESSFSEQQDKKQNIVLMIQKEMHRQAIEKLKADKKLPANYM
jgi:hypothetical protein